VDDERNRGGRPRSEEARTAVLHAVDDLLLEVGYAAMTMKGIAARAGVSRMTVYRWWSTKAEILLEASAADAEQELVVAPTGDATADLIAYLEALVRFLTDSAAGAAYRALLGEAQQDPAVALLLGAKDLLGDSARAVLDQIVEPVAPDRAVALLVGPVLYWLLSGHEPARLEPRALAGIVLRELRRPA
jgi:AcrR family transcriptional regulator